MTASKNADNSDKAIAATWQCSVRSVRRWRKQGAPLDDHAAMRKWLAGRKHLPPGTLALLEAATKADVAKAVGELSAPDTGAIGAPAALRRLEQFEANAFALLQTALKSGDPMAIRNARDTWLKAGDSLRRYDILVEQNRRTNDELVPRAEMERHVASFTHTLRLAGRRAASTIAPVIVGLVNPHEIAEIVTRSVWENVLSALAALSSSRCAAQLPVWWVKAAAEDMDNALRDCPEAVTTRRDAFEIVFDEMVKANAEQIAKPDSNP